MTVEKVFVREIVDGIEPNDTMGRYVEPNAKHPARFSNEIVVQAARAIEWHGIPGRLVLDPCAGTGGVHKLRDLDPSLKTVSVELEPEWVAQSIVDFPEVEAFAGDSTKLPRKWAGRFACVFTSPVYGNRMSDSHQNSDACSQCNGWGVVQASGAPFKRKPRDGQGFRFTCEKCKGSGLSPRRSYTHDLGRALSAGNVGRTYFWQEQYRDLQRALWREVERVLKPGGLFLLNVKDFERDRERQRVAYWHLRTCKGLGFERIETVRMAHRGMRYGANRHRAPNELLYVLRKAGS